MTNSFLVRVYDAHVSGSLVGRVTEVASGVTSVFRSSEELVAFLGAEAEPHIERRSDAEEEQ